MNTVINNYSDPALEAAFTQAREYIPGGVNSPVRAFKSVGGTPITFKSAQGPYVYDITGKPYIDYVLSWGPMILGHAHPDIVSAVQDAASLGLSFGAPTERETELAKLIVNLIPSIELVRLVNSGTEATMTAIRLARGFTGRNKIIKFTGCYHGHVDSLLVKAGSGALTLGVPTSPGITESIASQTITVPYNQIDGIEQAFQTYGDDIAGVIVEPVAGNMNLIPPVPGFLEGLRRVCDQYDSILIFDEVMTGFRVSLTGAQGAYNIRPDLTCLGKVVGGGMPMGAVGGKQSLMNHLAPDGPVYQAGTLSGNPVATAAGLTTLTLIQEDQFYQTIDKHVSQLLIGMKAAADKHGIPLLTHQAGSMLGIFFTDLPKITTFEDVMQCNQDHFKQFFHHMLTEGIYFAPSAFEGGFSSILHDNEIIQETISKADHIFSIMARN